MAFVIISKPFESLNESLLAVSLLIVALAVFVLAFAQQSYEAKKIRETEEREAELLAQVCRHVLGVTYLGVTR